MLKKLVIFTLFLLTATLSFSQNFLPKKVLYSKDTLILISPEQVIKINEIGYERGCYKELNDIKDNHILKLDSVSKAKDEKFNELLLSNKDLYQLTVDYKTNVETLNKQLNKEKRKAKRNIYLGIGSVIITSLTIGLIK